MPQYSIILLFVLFQQMAAAQSNGDSLRKYVVRLSTQPYARNAKNFESLNKASDFIHTCFSNYSTQTFFQHYTVNDTIYRNVIASFGPEDAPRMIVGAHYDVYGEAPGADANASGVAGLIELSRLLKKYEATLRYRIDLVAYTLGDIPHLNTKAMGSYVHAKSLSEHQVNVLGMLDLDCIGFYSDQPGTQRFPLLIYRWMYGNRGNFIGIIQQPGNGLWARQMRYLFKQYMNGLRVINFKPAVPFDGFADGDQKSYWTFGYSAILISNTKYYRNKNYHFDIDTYETLDYFRMVKVVDMIYKSLIHFKQ